MVATTRVLDTLKSIGLNLYERKIFVALLAKGVATAAEVSEIATVPRSRSYDVLQSLAEKGFVLVQPSKPIKYVALAPKDALERTQQILRKNYDEAKDRITSLSASPILKELEDIHKKGLDMVSPNEMTGTLKGKHIINRQLRSIFKDAQNRINICTTGTGLNDLYSNHFRVLKKVSKNGVKLKIAAPLGDNTAVRSFKEIAEMKNLKKSAGRFCVIDNNNVMVALTDDAKVHDTQDIAFWAKSEHAAKDLMSPFFEFLWKGSK